MDPGFAREFKTAIAIAIIASVIGLVVNIVRTPVLASMERSGKIHITQYNDFRGVNLIDDWSHEGRDITQKNGEPSVESNGDEPPIDENDIAPVAEVRRIEYPEVQMLFESGDVRFIDARSIEVFKAGRIIDATPWPAEEFLDYLEMYDREFLFDDHLIVYCDGGNCDLSEDLAEDLKLSGFLKIDIYLGGYDEWITMGMPVEKGELSR